MRWAEIGVATTWEAHEAVAQILLDIGCGGVAISGVSSPFVTGHLPVNDSLEPKLTVLKSRIQQLKTFGLDPGKGEVMLGAVADEDWAEAWKAYFKPLRVGRRLVIKPSWESVALGPEDVVVEIDPGQAFGTGTHPSTRLALEALERHLIPGQPVFDIGTGSGILSIAAVHLGASLAWATDCDPIAVAAARKNVELNGVADRVEIVEQEGLPATDARPQVVVANIVAGIVARLAPEVARCLQPGGVYIASGIVLDKAPLVTQAFADAGLHLLETLTEHEWVTCVAGKEESRRNPHPSSPDAPLLDSDSWPLKNMHRFFVPSPIDPKSQVTLAGEQAHQITRVLRLRPGDRIALFDGTPYEYLCEIRSADSIQVTAQVISTRRPQVEAEIRLTLAQSLLKGDKIEWVLQKATELGVAAVRLLVTERTVADLPESRLPSRLARWHKVMVEAAEQSGRLQVPELHPPLKLGALWMHLTDFDHAFMPWECAKDNSFAKALCRQSQARRLLVVIGPEGGFSEREARAACQAGVELVSLGSRILRAETASIAATALALYQESVDE